MEKKSLVLHLFLLRTTKLLLHNASLVHHLWDTCTLHSH